MKDNYIDNVGFGLILSNLNNLNGEIKLDVSENNIVMID